MSRSYAIVGTGAVGGFYGLRLVEAGFDVHFLLRSDFDHVRQHGLVLESPLGDVRVERPNAYADPAAMPPIDVVLVALKTTANHQLPRLLPPLLGPNTVVVMLQNGLGNEERAADLVGYRPLMGGLSLCSNRVGPGHIQHLDFGRATLAQHQASTITDDVRAVGRDIEATGVPVVLETTSCWPVGRSSSGTSRSTLYQCCSTPFPNNCSPTPPLEFWSRP